MGTEFIYRSGDKAAPASLSAVPLLLGTSADGDVGTSYTVDPGDDVAGTIGPGKVSALAIAHGAIGRCVISPVAATYPALPAVTKTGAGPSITIALTAAGVGPHDDAPGMKLTVTSDGKRMDVSYDGTSTAETFVIPPEGPAVLRGKVDISGNDVVVNGKHLDFTSPSSDVITFAADAASAAPAGLLAATATVAAQVVLTADDLIAGGVTELDTWARNLTFTTAGVTPANAPATVQLDGFDAAGVAQTETITLAQTATIASGTKAFRGTGLVITYPAADGTAATVSIGWGSVFGPSTPAEMVTDFNAAATLASLDMQARIHEASTGEQYLELYSTSTGAGITATIDATGSTADGTLGFTSASPQNLTAAGAAATRDFEWLGVTATFPAGPYTAATTYAMPLRGPRGAVADYVAALTSACGDFAAHPFGYVVVCEDPATNANARALYDALRQLAATYQSDPDSPILFDVLTPTALHTASAVKATNTTAITAWESSLATAFAGATVSLESVVVDDCYVAGPPGMPGIFRRPATWAAAFRRSSLDRLAGNPCDGRAPLVTLVGADGTRARDDAKSTTKLAGLGGAGFWALKSMADGGTKFAPSATRAGALDRYRSPGTVAFALEASRVILPQLQEWEGTWETDPNSPKAADPALLGERASVLEALVRPVAYPPAPGAPKNVANFAITMSAPTVLDDGIVLVFLDFNPLAVAETVRATITPTGVALATGG